ncbi:MAG: amidohydrolase family protein [Lachnospiraceae bacterium]|nr:amidohydrolase family protein [Lachnospiraceae bacterium]
MIIDFHTHTFPDSVSERALKKLAMAADCAPNTDGTLHGLEASTQRAHIDFSINLPVATSPAQVEKINRQNIANQEKDLREGILHFGAMHPDYENYRTELHYLKEHHVKGIKLHPAYQGVDLNDICNKRIIEEAASLGLIILIHAGIDIGIHDHDYAPVKQILEIVREIHPPVFVLAHMGGWAAWDDVERDLTGAPVFLDTAFTYGPNRKYPDAAYNPLSDVSLSNEQFVRIVRKHGADRILFGSDSPWKDQSSYLALLNEIGLSDAELKMIKGDNAAGLLGL